MIRARRIDWRGDGRERLEVSVTVSRLTKPTLLGLMTLREISHHRPAEAALRDSEQRYRQLIDAAPEAIGIIDITEGRFVDVNDNMVKLTRLNREQLLQMGLLGFSPEHQPDGRSSAQVITEFTRRALGGETLTFEWVHLDSAGDQVDCEVRLVRLSDRLLRGSAIDIGPRKRAARALAASEERFRKVVDHLPESILVMDMETGKFMVANVAAEEMFGLPAERICEVGPAELSPPTQPNGQTSFEAARERIGKVAAGETETFAWAFQHASGRLLPCEVRLLPLHIEGQHLVLGSVTDITDRIERENAEQQLREMEEQLRHAVRLSTMGEMVAGIAHEINQPIFSIRNFSTACMNVLQQGADQIPNALEYAQEIDKQAVRTSEIMKRLADFVRQTKPRRSIVGVNQLTDEAIGLAAFEADRWNVTVHRELEQPGHRILVDGVQVQQVLVNLLRNACEALQANSANDRHVTVRTLSHGNQVEIEVADNGPGFSDEVASKLFETFYSTKEQGMGMGLAIARSIIKEHGGSLRVYRNRDGGATFTLSLQAEGEQLNAVGADGLHCG